MNVTHPNPLLAADALPDFAAISASHVESAIQDLAARCEQALERATHPDTPADYKTLTEILEEPLQAFAFAWSTINHLQSVANTPEMRAAYASAQPKVTELHTRISSDLRLFDLYKRAMAAGENSLSAPQLRTLSHSIRGFWLSGADLAPTPKNRFVATQQRSAELSREFSNHLLDATDAFAYWASAQELAGVPDDVLRLLRHAALASGREDDVYKLSLQLPCLGPVLQYADDRKLRETLYQAHATRASELGPSNLDNTALITEILELRHERAALLGLAHHAEVSLIPKMADSPAVVLDFLRDLAKRSRPQAQCELEELTSFAREQLDLPELQIWDVAYASEKLRQTRHAFSETEVKQYFSLNRVLQGIFEVAETLFDAKICITPQAVWHPDVTAYRVERDGEILGHFFLDPYARSGKRAGAWMDGALPRWRKPNGDTRTAMAYLVTNFASPVGGQPALMSHQDVVTLCHEFGHGFHFLLSQIDVLGVSGVSGVEWDAVELPSQLMENYAWEWSFLKGISAHAQTGATLPPELFQKMCRARNFQSGMQLMRQIELALFDMRLHAEPTRSGEAQVLMNEVRAEMALMRTPPYTRFQNSFSHIFAGSYSAGYYSYLWAEVLSADAWSEFKKAGAFDAETGRRYRETILERGGSRPTKDNFISFVGRAPQIDALLRQRGIRITS